MRGSKSDRKISERQEQENVQESLSYRENSNRMSQQPKISLKLNLNSHENRKKYNPSDMDDLQ